MSGLQPTTLPGAAGVLPAGLLTTGIGSLPHTQLELGLQQAMQVDIPYLPSLPAIDAAELMVPQVLEGLPGLRFDAEGTCSVDLRAWERRAEAFGAALDRGLHSLRLESFEPSALACRAWKPFLFEVEHRGLRLAKAQCTGPLTAQWVLRLEGDRPISAIPALEKQVFRLVLARALAMVRALRARGATPLFFLDEPGLYALDRRDPLAVVKLQDLRIAALALRKEGALVGLHCCSNTDWRSVLGLGLDVLSLDARLSLEAVVATGPALQRFFAEGGVLSLGVIPTNLAAEYDVPALVDATRALLSAAAEPRGGASASLLRQVLLTPACGLGLRSVRDAEQAFSDLHAAQGAFRSRT